MPYCNNIHLIGMLLTDPRLEYWTQKHGETAVCSAYVLVQQRRRGKKLGTWVTARRLSILVRAFGPSAERWKEYQTKKDWIHVVGELDLTERRNALTEKREHTAWIRANSIQFLLPRIRSSKTGHVLVTTSEFRDFKMWQKLQKQGPTDDSPWSPEEIEQFEEQVEMELDQQHEALTDAEKANMLLFEEWDQSVSLENQPRKLAEDPTMLLPPNEMPQDVEALLDGDLDKF